MNFIFAKRNRLLILLCLLLSVTAYGISDLSNDASKKQPATAAEALSLKESDIHPSIKHTRAAEEILLKLQRRHYEKRKFDDNLSSELFDSYLENLDPGKSFFIQEDIDRFEAFRYQLDDGVRRGELSPPFIIFNSYRDIALKHLDYTVKNLSRLIAEIDFSIEESIVVDTEQLQWPENAQARHDRLRKNLKNAVLNLRLSDKDSEDINETLSKRYKNQLNRLKTLNDEDVFQLYMNSLTALYDPHTSYMSPRSSENFSINMSLSLEGIGAVLTQDGEFTVVDRLVPGGPADLQGELKPKDKIISVAQGAEGQAEDIVGWRLDEVVQLIRGKKGTKVRLEIVSGEALGSDDARTIQITRNKVKLEEQAAQSEVIDIYHQEATRKVGVITVPTFYHDYEAQMRGEKNYRSTTRDVYQLLQELEEDDVEGIVIDLRGNGGGYLEEAKSLTGLFVERGPVVQIKQANGRIKPHNNYPNPQWYSKPIVVLIDRLSASASEIFAGAIQDYNRGLVIGSPSFGKGTVQGLQALNHGQIKLTEAKYYRISGESTQHRGVVPNIELPSLYDSSEIGEASLTNALSWDSVPSLPHKKYGDLQETVGKVLPLHQARVANDPDYRFYHEQLAVNDKYRNLEQLSLNEATRKALREQDKKERLDIENQRRVAKGLEPLEALKDDDTEGEDSGESADNEFDNNSDDADIRSDFFLTEAANILLDSLSTEQDKMTRTDRVAIN